MRSFAIIATFSLVSVLAAPATPLSTRDTLESPSRRSSAALSIPKLANNFINLISTGATAIGGKISTTFVPISSFPQPSITELEEPEAEEEEYFATTYQSDVKAWEDKHVQCAEICRVRTIEGAMSGHDALCSTDGLESTLACAQCIDATWPEDLWENTAMSEYNRIAKSCESPEAFNSSS